MSKTYAGETFLTAWKHVEETPREETKEGSDFENTSIGYINSSNDLFRLLRSRGVSNTPPPMFYCESCGRAWPDFFTVSKVEWERYVEEDKQDCVLCRKCYDERKVRAAKGKRKRSYFKNFERVMQRRAARMRWLEGPEGRKYEELLRQGKTMEAYQLSIYGEAGE